MRNFPEFPDYLHVLKKAKETNVTAEKRWRLRCWGGTRIRHRMTQISDACGGVKLHLTIAFRQQEPPKEVGLVQSLVSSYSTPNAIKAIWLAWDAVRYPTMQIWESREGRGMNLNVISILLCFFPPLVQTRVASLHWISKRICTNATDGTVRATNLAVNKFSRGAHSNVDVFSNVYPCSNGLRNVM